MISIRRLGSVLFLALCFSSYSNAQDTTQVATQTYNISDDGYANVPLQFGFPYYGQTFTNSWMFSNGIISFQDPEQSGLAWWNLSVQDFSTAMGSQFNYSIFPLWTDLININGSFTSQGNSEFQRYSWLGISPFYDPNRLNTFSVEIRPDGQIIANYSLINVDYARVGTVGDASKGEFEQIYSSPGSITNWDRYTQGSDPTISEPESPPLVTVTPMYEIVDTNTGVDVLLVETQQSTSTISLLPGTSNNTTPIESTQISNQVEQAPSSGSGINLNRVLSIVAREQARIGNLERSVVESSIDQSISQGLQATQQANDIAGIAVTESISIGIASAQSQTAIDQQQSLQTPGGGINFLSESSASLSSSDSNQGLRVPDLSIMEQGSSSILTEQSRSERNIASQSKNDEIMNDGESKNQSVSVAGFSAVDVLKEEKNTINNESQTEQRTQTVRPNVPNNELAGSVTIASLGAPPQGFQAYSITMPDSSFYAPREIYRNQRTIDNPAGRRLFGATDRLHRDMVDQQYAR